MYVCMWLLSRQCRLSSAVEEKGLSLMEYIHRKQEEERVGPKKKRVSSQCFARTICWCSQFCSNKRFEQNSLAETISNPNKR